MKCAKSNNVCVLKLLKLRLFRPHRSILQTMPGARMPDEFKWQIFGFHRAGPCFKEIDRKTGRHYNTIGRQVHKHAHTNDVRNRKPSGLPHKTLRRDDRALIMLVRRQPFASSATLKRQFSSSSTDKPPDSDISTEVI